MLRVRLGSMPTIKNCYLNRFHIFSFDCGDGVIELSILMSTEIGQKLRFSNNIFSVETSDKIQSFRDSPATLNLAVARLRSGHQLACFFYSKKHGSAVRTPDTRRAGALCQGFARDSHLHRRANEVWAPARGRALLSSDFVRSAVRIPASLATTKPIRRFASSWVDCGDAGIRTLEGV